jgi:hypothetical protein
MVYLGGPRGRGPRRRGLYLHTPPPGYRPPRTRMAKGDRQRMLRQDYILMRVTTVVLVGVAVALVVLFVVMIATHS